MTLNTYVISCYSDCGSYFGSYLQSLTVLAESPEQAKEFAKEWQEENESFLYEEKKWTVREVSNCNKPGVIDSVIDSDY